MRISLMSLVKPHQLNSGIEYLILLLKRFPELGIIEVPNKRIRGFLSIAGFYIG